ncbi:MAG: carbohydrate kinase [Candidatus Nealsonbacteria bacterium]|nr:carbohydrate kinase [Candidatus Nealsonbacteria bacterium]
MPAQRLAELTGRFSQLRIAVIGDFFLDKYLDVDPAMAELSVETGKTAHQVVGIRHSPGAAGTVVCNLAALTAGAIHAVGFTGDDGEAYDLRRDLQSLGCTTEHLHCDPHRATPTYLKPRDRTEAGLAGEHSRYDTKNRTPTADDVQQRILASLDALLPRLDAVVILDQVEEPDCGVVTAEVRRALADRAECHPGVVFWADSRRHICQFRRTIIKPNQFEAVGRHDPVPGDNVPLDDLAAAVARLRSETGAAIFATRGAEGMVVSDPELTLVPGVRIEGPTDPTGAGDSATAGATLALAAGADYAEAALIGNLVASITVEQLATTGTARPDQLASRLERWQSQQGGV